jgi:hypothetical protein
MHQNPPGGYRLKGAAALRVSATAQTLIFMGFILPQAAKSDLTGDSYRVVYLHSGGQLDDRRSEECCSVSAVALVVWAALSRQRVEGVPESPQRRGTRTPRAPVRQAPAEPIISKQTLSSIPS